MLSGIILASGFSKRMGQEKLLLQAGETTIIERVIQAAVESKLDESVLIYRRNAVKRVATLYPVEMVRNCHADQGQSSAVRLGIASVNQNAAAYLFMVGDQPFLTSEIINTVLAAHREDPGKIIVPTCQGTQGNPVLFPAAFRDELLAVEGDRGGRDIIRRAAGHVRYLEFGTASICFDIDTSAEYQHLQQVLEQPGVQAPEVK